MPFIVLLCLICLAVVGCVGHRQQCTADSSCEVSSYANDDSLVRYMMYISIDSPGNPAPEVVVRALTARVRATAVGDAEDWQFRCGISSNLDSSADGEPMMFDTETPLHAVVCEVSGPRPAAVRAVVTSPVWRQSVIRWIEDQYSGQITVAEQLLNIYSLDSLDESGQQQGSPALVYDYVVRANDHDRLQTASRPTDALPIAAIPSNAPGQYGLFADLEQELLQRQMPPPGVNSNDWCRGRRAIVFSFDSFNRYGFATALHHISLALAYARETNRILVMRDPDRWIYTRSTSSAVGDGEGEVGCVHGFHCFFEPVSGCTEALVSALVDGEKPWQRSSLHDATENNRVVYYTSAGATYGLISKTGGAYRVLWWRAHLMRFLLQPLAAERQALVQFRRDHEWPTDGSVRSLGLHIRHGDKITEVARLHAWNEYLAKAELLMRKQAAQRDTPSADNRNPPSWIVFVSSDDPAVIEAARSPATAERLLAAARPASSVRVIHRPERRINAAVHAALASGSEDGLEQGRIALQNIWLLSTCDELVGTFSSSFFKLAFELRFAYRGLAQATSLDLSSWRP